ncbi:MAG: UDP-N-acetylglucosamine 1-carboxyvinyltransferase [Bacillota bacterium]|nr:UDP-N-acetylglucosamine 1-carboxyvinyltransferase [Bacillota bacterium]HHU60772.1 UDP-N-acetylglucosamine 1-carboxyvinyltransferase [Natronincola sp.]
MNCFQVEGGHHLEGKIRINGAKNSALKLMVASLLGNGKYVLSDVPHISDVYTMCEVLQALGAEVALQSNILELNVTSIHGRVPDDLAKSMRASIQVMGPLLAKLGWVKVAHPGGCAIGTRPLDLHLKGLRKMGASIDVKDELLIARANKLHGANIHLHYPSVGATENIMMAATLAQGDTIISNAAREPEIVDVQNYLNKMGAKISGAGTSAIKITGVKELEATNYSVIPDRIEAGTYLLALLITGGKGTLTNVRPKHFASLIKVVREMGAYVDIKNDSITLDSPQKLLPFHLFTEPYPGFPTDLQPQMVAVATQAHGISLLTESVFDRRFGYITELQKLGAKVDVEEGQARVIGDRRLKGTGLVSRDLRAGAALVLASLCADGHSTIEGIEHIERGYESMELRLRELGAKISRITC